MATMDNLVGARDKVSKVLNSGKIKNLVNPFLDKSGNLRNPYINYQKVLNSNNVSSRAKEFIQEATGLSPTVATPKAVTPKTANTTTLSTVNNSVPRSDSGIVNAAKNYIGTPYVWGGESSQEGGMVCSGFVYNALKDAGYKVGRTTAQGYRSFGTPVQKSDMQPGDLVFFGNDKKASHIGIYIGNGQMIHSSGNSKNTKSNPGKGVSVADVDYRSDFLEARRY